MENNQNILFNDEFDEDITINFKKIFFAIWNRKYVLVATFFVIFVWMIISTFITPKVYVVDSDLYINKTNNSNLLDVNPYVIDEATNSLSISGVDKTIMNEIELIKSPLVMEKVIVDNDIKIKKLYGFIKTKKTGQYVPVDKFLKKGIKIDNKKNTNIVSISYKSKDRELAFNVVNSIILHYMELQKDFNSEKAKSDIKLLETKYKIAKESLNKKMSSAHGLPANAVSGAGNLAAMSAFSASAQKAISNIQGQYMAGEKSKLAVEEEATKVANLSTKLEWAKLVEQMSESSKIKIIKEPKFLQEYEQTSPKLFMNIVLGIVFGVIGALIALITIEIFDKKLTYSMLDDEIIYNFEKDLIDFKALMSLNRNKRLAVVNFEKINDNMIEKIKSLANVQFITPDVTNSFIEQIVANDGVIMIVSVNKTSAKEYKIIKEMIKKENKEIITEILV